MKRLTVDEAVEFLKNGQLVIIPTETVYGIASDGFNIAAVKKIFEIKKRPNDKPITLQVADLKMVQKLVTEVPNDAKNLMERYWPGPLTIILKKKTVVSDVLTGNKDSVGLRMPDHPQTLEIIKKCGFPLAVPSANITDQKAPTNPEQVEEMFKDGDIAGIIDGGECSLGVESTIVDLSSGKPHIIREGAIKAAEIMNFLG